MWSATVDYQKAFESVEHSSIWIALESQSIGQPCVKLLRV